MLDWCQRHKMRLNISKSKCLLITRQEVVDLGSSIACERSVRLLGLHLNHRLNWNDHVAQLRRICGRRLHLLRRLRSLVSPSELQRVYDAIIRSLFDYVCPVFIGMNKKQASILQRIENRAIRIINSNPNDGKKRDLLHDRRLDLGHRLWLEIEKDEAHILRSLLPPRLPRSGHLALSSYRTSTYGNTFFPYFSRYLNSNFVHV